MHTEGQPGGGINRLTALGREGKLEHPKIDRSFRKTTKTIFEERLKNNPSNTEYIRYSLIPEILETYQLINASVPSAEKTYFLVKKINGSESQMSYQDQVKINDQKRVVNPKNPWNRMNTVSFLILTNLVKFNESEEIPEPYSINHEKFKEYGIEKINRSNQPSVSEQVS